jgi:hypothetical protein
MTTTAVADPEAREFLRNADPVLARVIEAHPDFHPRAWHCSASACRSRVEQAKAATRVLSGESAVQPDRQVAARSG